LNERKRRIGENEAVFRTINEQINGLTLTLANTTETMSIVCECGTRTCTDQFLVAVEEYTRVRADATLFLIRPGHDLPESETVIEKTDDFWVVRKDPGLAAEFARATDPR
jgi:hypothetical protein